MLLFSHPEGPHRAARITTGPEDTVTFDGLLGNLRNASVTKDTDSNGLFGKGRADLSWDTVLVNWCGYCAHIVADKRLAPHSVAGGSIKTDWIPTIPGQLRPLGQRTKPLRYSGTDNSLGPIAGLAPFRNPADTRTDTAYFRIDLDHFTGGDGELAQAVMAENLIDTFARRLYGCYRADRAYIRAYWPGQTDGASRL